MSIKFIPVYEDLIDLKWTKNRAPLPNSQIYIQPLQFAGTCTIELNIAVHVYNYILCLNVLVNDIYMYLYEN